MSTSYETEPIEHFGLVAGMFDELGVGELIDKDLPAIERRHTLSFRAVLVFLLRTLGHSPHQLR